MVVKCQACLCSVSREPWALLGYIELATDRLDARSLPRKWYELSDDSLRNIGDRWIDAGKTVALHVPSAAIRGEWNILLNPAHRDFRKLRIEKPKAFAFDLRMFR